MPECTYMRITVAIIKLELSTTFLRFDEPNCVGHGGTCSNNLRKKRRFLLIMNFIIMNHTFI